MNPESLKIGVEGTTFEKLPQLFNVNKGGRRRQSPPAGFCLGRMVAFPWAGEPRLGMGELEGRNLLTRLF